jgi:hypothetical protein
MKFNDPSVVESVCYDIRLADYVRGKNRARINNLFNGVKPFENDDENPVNVNFLEGTRLAHDARAQFYGAFLKPGRFFSLNCDAGAKYKRRTYSDIVTAQMNKIIKRDIPYFETMRSKFAMNVLHGIGPSAWRDGEHWRPSSIGIEDVGIPANTLLSMENLPFFYIYRSYTVPELKKLIRDEKKAKEVGWDVDLVNSCIKWVDKQSVQLMGSNWPEVWSPEKVAERIKGDGTFYSSDQVPTIDTFDFYFWNDAGKESGWSRRIILDAWSTPSGQGGGESQVMKKDGEFMRGKFLLNAGDRKYAADLKQLIAFQFADLSSVAPFRYHSVRSLGFLTYAACHLQNRMRCRFSMAAFESAMNYIRINSSEQAERALKIEMINMGVIDETVKFVPPSERWQVNTQLIELFLRENKSIIDSNTASYTQQASNTPGDRKTKFQVMAETSQASALVSAALNQAYHYQVPEYEEIVRRFMRPNSSDPDVRAFRAACLSREVPEEILRAENWGIEPERVMGAGNKTMEMQIAEQLMNMRNLYDPEPQRDILRRVTTSITDDPDWAMQLVPVEPLKVSDTVHDAQLSIATLMQGYPVAVKTGQNHKEYIQVLLSEMSQEIQGIEKSGGMASPEKIKGFHMVEQCITQHLKLLEQDKAEKQFVTEAAKQLAKVMNLVRAFEQRLQEQMKKQQQQAQQKPDPAAQAKLQVVQATGAVKLKNARESHAMKMAQKQLEFEQQMALENKKLHHEQHRENVKAVHEFGRKQLESVNGEE